MTDQRIEELRRLCKAALPCGWAGDRLTMEVVPEHLDPSDKQYHPTTIWYDDGDQCATVYDNMGLGFSGDNVARLFAASLTAIPELLAEVERLRALANKKDGE